jgi:polyisoprenoid-binding protein YceI
MGRRRRFTVDTERSSVAIEARSSVHPIRGETNGVEGTIEVTVDGDEVVLSPPPEARIELPVGRLSSGNRIYDNEMQRRIEARRFPTIVGELGTVTPGEGRGSFHVAGALHFHGQASQVEADVTAEVGPRRLVADWEQVIDIRDFGVDPPRILLLRVYPEVTVTVHIEADAAADDGRRPKRR